MNSTSQTKAVNRILGVQTSKPTNRIVGGIETSDPTNPVIDGIETSMAPAFDTNTTGATEIPHEALVEVIPSIKPLNVQAKYRNWETREVREDLAKTRSDFITVAMNLEGDFNLSSLLRNTNWFNGHAFWVLGRKRYDKRGAVGTFNYTEVEHRAEPLAAIQELKDLGYRVVAAEIDERSVELQHYEFPQKVAVIFGEEGPGLSQEILDACDDIVAIPGRGSVRSLNVANSGGIFLWEYHRQRGYFG